MSVCPKCGYATTKKERSNNQNRYYFGVIVDILSDHTGFTRDEVHEILKSKFLRRTMWIPKKTGIMEMSVISYSTTELTTVQFEKYLSEIREWASLELGINLPEPNEEEDLCTQPK